jgi:TPR repeat protein
VNFKSVLLFLLMVVLTGSSYASLSKAYDAYSGGNYVKAFELIEPMAKQGDARAQFRLGHLYDAGKGVSKDHEKAYKWYLKSAKQGFKTAQYNLAIMYEKGEGVSQSNKQAIKWYTKAAKQDHTKSQYNLASMHDDAGDFNLSVKWYTEAAKKNHSKSQNNLALLYEYGFGVEKNYKQSIIWYLLAIENKGSTKAEENLNTLLIKMNGDSKPVYNKAVKNYNKDLYSKAFPQFLWLALQGNVRAETYIGVMYAQESWVTKDYQQASKWYKKAANKGYKIAQHNLGTNYDSGKGVSKDYKEAVKWYRKAANQGYSKSQYNLANMYRKGDGVAQSDKQAIKWYMKAAKQNHLKSQFGLGYLYDTSETSVQDSKKAAKWYKKAASRDHALAQYNLALLYEYGNGVSKNIDMALKWYREAANQGDKDAKAKIKKLVALQDLEVMPTLKEARKDYDAEDYYSAFPKFLKLANQGDADAQGYLGWMYDLGKGTEEDNYEAVKWYQKASEQGVRFTQHNLGLMYEKGEGVSKDINKALKWYRKAAAQGDEKAKSRLEKILVAQGGENNEYTVFSGSGTGFLVSKNGVFATNQHVIDGCGRIVVDEKDAKLVLQDKTNDLALIKVDKTYDKVSRLSYRSPSLGSDVSVFGYPLSDMMSEKHISLTKGSVSSLAGMDGNLSNFRFTAPVQPGNSGGPIVNKDGKVVGITRAVLGKTTLEKGDFLPQNVNFGIRSSLLINMMESKMIPVNDTPLKVEDIVKHYVKTTKYIKCYE